MAKILIVEDSVSQASIISEIVKKLGHEPVVCREFTRSLAHTILSHIPDVVLLDLILLGPDGKPVADGFQICKDLKKLSEGTVKVVVVSSKDDEESAEWALMQGADAFLKKPFVVEDLVNVLNVVLE
jgi:DNA-binding response OmpR family regulator